MAFKVNSAVQSLDGLETPAAGMEAMDSLTPVVPIAKGSREKRVVAMPAVAAAASIGKPLAAPELRVETISDYDSFLELEQVWNRLVEQAGIDHPFLRHEWVRSWWESFGAGKRLHIVVVKAGEEAIAIAPLMASRTRMYGLKVRRLEFLNNVHTPRFDFIIARRQEEAYRAIWTCLLSQKKQWDLLEMCEVPTASQTLKELPRLAVEGGCLIGLWPSAKSPYVPLQGTWDDYFKRLKGHHRSNMRNRLKRLEQLGQIEMEVVTSGEQVESALEEGLRIEAAAWKGKTRSAINCHDDIRHFYKGFAGMAAERGWLRLYFLNVNGKRIAFFYALCFGNKLYVLKIGYDPNFAAYSPGNVLTYMIMRNAFELGMAEYDILGVDDKWKLDWTKEVRPHCWIFVFSDGLRARLLHWAKFQVVPRLKQQRFYLSVRDASVAALAFLVALAEKTKPLGTVREAKESGAKTKAFGNLWEKISSVAAANR